MVAVLAVLAFFLRDLAGDDVVGGGRGSWMLPLISAVKASTNVSRPRVSWWEEEDGPLGAAIAAAFFARPRFFLGALALGGGEGADWWCADVGGGPYGFSNMGYTVWLRASGWI